jgi:hypothetical protein
VRVNRRLRIGLILALVAILGAAWVVLASLHRDVRVFTTVTDMWMDPEPAFRLPEVAAADGSRFRNLGSRDVTLQFHTDGRITYRIYPRDEAFLRELLQEQSDVHRDLDDPMQSSEVNLILRFDRRAPWSAVQKVIDIAGDGEIRMTRMHAVVEVPGVAGEQTISLTSPLIRLNVLYHLQKRTRMAWGPRFELSAGADLTPLDEFVRANLPRVDGAVSLVAVDGDVPAGEVIEFVQRFRAAGGENVLFVNPDLESLGDPVLELR